MKIFIVAAAAWAAGALLGYFVARLAYKHLRKRLRTLRQERKPPKKKMGTMDRILVLENGVMGWIKTNKDKAAEAAGTSGSGTQPPPEEPPAGTGEPPDAGL